MYIEVGKIVGVWGVKGWVKLHSYTRNREDISNYPIWYLSKADRDTPLDLSGNATVTEIRVEQCRAQGQSIVASLADVDTRDAAAALQGLSILVKQDDLPKLGEQEFYWHQLIGLTVKNTDGEIGVIKTIIETGANDVLVVQSSLADQASEILIPYIDSVVLSVELADSAMFVDWDPADLQD